MPKHVQARTAQDAQEERQGRKLAGATMPLPIGSFTLRWSSRAGQARRPMRSQLSCIVMPKQCVTTWPASTQKGSMAWGCEQGLAASHA